MQLHGRLRLTTLGDLLGALLRERLSGTLELTEERGPTAGRVHAVHLNEGLIVQIDSPTAVARVGEILVAGGWLDPTALAGVLGERVGASVPVGQRLVKLGIVSTLALETALRNQIRQRLDAVFRLEDAQVTFRLVRPRRRELDVRTPLLPEEYLRGRPRARDRNRHQVRTPAPMAAKQWNDRHDGLRLRDLQLLGLGPAADREMIRSAFRRLARATHPDRYPLAQPEKLERLRQRFADLSAAYHRLAG